MRHAYKQDSLAGAVFRTRAVSSAQTCRIWKFQPKFAKKKKDRIHEPECRNGSYVKTATQLLSATLLSATLATLLSATLATLSYSIDTLLKCCASCTKRKNDLLAWEFEAENQRFPASFSYKAIFSKLKNYQNAALPRLLTLCQVCAALTLRFTKTASSPHHKMPRQPTNCRMQQHKVLRLPQKRHASIDTLPKYLKADAWQPGAGRRGLCWRYGGLSWTYLSPMLPLCSPMLAVCRPMSALCWPKLALACPYVGLMVAYVGAMLAYIDPILPTLSCPYVDPMFTYVGLRNPLRHSSDRNDGGADGVTTGWGGGGNGVTPSWGGGWGGAPL